MKNLTLTLIIGLILSISPAIKANVGNAGTTDKITVYYFHYSHRCATCIAVEDESLKAVKELYAEDFKNGNIVFESLNLDEEKNNEIAEKLEISGQTLLIVKKDKKIDITNDGFLYAKSNPAKLKEVIEKSISPLLK